MRDAVVAARYAKALFLVTERRRETHRALEDLKGVLAAFGPGTRPAAFLASPEVPFADKRRVLSQALTGQAVNSVLLFVDMLLRKKRLPELSGIVEAFEALVEEQAGIQRAQVVSATPLTSDELARLHAELERTTGRKIKLTTAVDPRLVGGAFVRLGDRVIDRSVTTLLESLSRRLYEVSV